MKSVFIDITLTAEKVVDMNYLSWSGDSKEAIISLKYEVTTSLLIL
jgi:hypothetical protein